MRCGWRRHPLGLRPDGKRYRLLIHGDSFLGAQGPRFHLLVVFVTTSEGATTSSSNIHRDIIGVGSATSQDRYRHSPVDRVRR